MVFGAILNNENQKKHEKRASILKLIVEGRSDSGTRSRKRLPKRGWNPTSPAHVPRMTWVAQGKLPQINYHY